MAPHGCYQVHSAQPRARPDAARVMARHDDWLWPIRVEEVEGPLSGQFLPPWQDEIRTAF